MRMPGTLQSRSALATVHVVSPCMCCLLKFDWSKCCLIPRHPHMAVQTQVVCCYSLPHAAGTCSASAAVAAIVAWPSSCCRQAQQGSAERRHSSRAHAAQQVWWPAVLTCNSVADGLIVSCAIAVSPGQFDVCTQKLLFAADLVCML
jgi:hypothetical protein